MSHGFSEEHLNAFIDNEIDTRGKQQLFDAFRHNEPLRRQVCELQKTRDLVKLTYGSTEIPEKYLQPLPRKSRPWLLRGMAAGLLLIIGSCLGWFTHLQLYSGQTLMELASLVQPGKPAVTDNTAKIMLHVSTNDPYRLNVMLEETEHLLQQHRQSGNPIFIEILANGSGLEVVNNRGSASAIRLQQLQSEYQNLFVSACSQAIKRLQKDTGVKFEPIPNTRIVRSGLGEAIKRQQDGWTYIRI